MKRWMTRWAVVAALALPAHAFAGGGGYYDWFLSFSSTDPDAVTGPDPAGLVNISLWFMAGCSPSLEGPGLAAAELRAYPSGSSPWTIIAFVTANGFLNAGSSTDLLLAVGGCPTGPLVAGDFLVSASGPGGLWLGESALGDARIVDCSIDAQPWSWPEFVRFRGCQSVSSPYPVQDHGSGCTVTSVEESSWGTIKSLYR